MTISEDDLPYKDGGNPYCEGTGCSHDAATDCPDCQGSGYRDAETGERKPCPRCGLPAKCSGCGADQRGTAVFHFANCSTPDLKPSSLRQLEEDVIQSAREWSQARKWSEPGEKESYEYGVRNMKAEIRLHDSVARLWGQNVN